MNLYDLPDRIIFFDGICILCNRSVDFILKNDRKRKFSMASLQSEFTGEFFRQKGFDPEGKDSIILYDEGKFYWKSDAVVRIARNLDFPFSMLRFCVIIPRFLRNPVYQFIAGKRYKWFGKMDRCRLPDDETRGRIFG